MLLAVLLCVLCGLGGAISFCGKTVDHALACFVPWLLPVGLVIEVGEEDDEGDCVCDKRPLHPGREWAARVERVSGMADCHMKLDHLNYGQVLFPPQILLHVGSKGGQAIVTIHQYMDTRVYGRTKERLATGDPFDANPPQNEHGAVVVDVQEADLVKLLPHDEEHCVQKLHPLGDVVPPQC